MCYAYWKSKKDKDVAVFDLFFRKTPFEGEFAIFCGLEEVLRFLKNFSFSKTDISYLKSVLDTAEPEFFDYLSSLSAKDVKLWSLDEGSLAFPRVPVITVEGPVAVLQLLETPMLNLVNYASLVCTNACRFRLAAGPNSTLFEFGLRRAQGPNGGMTASKYTYIGGFDATSNTLAGKLYHIPVQGTHAHSFVSSFNSLDDLNTTALTLPDGRVEQGYLDVVLQFRREVCSSFDDIVPEEVFDGELAAFVAYSLAFPSSFLALIDTYDALKSGVVNFCACALALWKFGYRSIGVRIDSGDLAYLSKETRRMLTVIGSRYGLEWFQNLKIVASNDINEETLLSLKEQVHCINTYGIGTHLVTCQKQPALGCVYKLVSIGGKPSIKLSQQMEKVTIPMKKRAYRLFGKDGSPIADLLTLCDEQAPKAEESILCRHPFQENKRAHVVPKAVLELQSLYWEEGRIVKRVPDIEEIKRQVQSQVSALRSDHKRALNPTPYKVSLSLNLYEFFHKLWLSHAPIGKLQ